jgi:hypothetical protein
MDTLMDRADPGTIARAARALGCRSVAYTYNDPVIFHEYAIDTAQGMGTVNSLDLFKVLEDNRMLRATMQGRAKGGRISSDTSLRGGTTKQSSGMNDMSLRVIKKNTEVLSEISSQLRTPIRADVSLTGRKSLEERQRELNRITTSSSF